MFEFQGLTSLAIDCRPEWGLDYPRGLDLFASTRSASAIEYRNDRNAAQPLVSTRFANAMTGIPAGSNFFSSVFTTLSRRKVANLFVAVGFDVRKCGWYAFELFSPWAELVIEAEAPILMHGSVVDVVVNAERLLDCLREAKVSFDAECYAPDGALLREWHVTF